MWNYFVKTSFTCFTVVQCSVTNNHLPSNIQISFDGNIVKVIHMRKYCDLLSYVKLASTWKIWKCVKYGEIYSNSQEKTMVINFTGNTENYVFFAFWLIVSRHYTALNFPNLNLTSEIIIWKVAFTYLHPPHSAYMDFWLKKMHELCKYNSSDMINIGLTTLFYNTLHKDNTIIIFQLSVA
jgi:hypothetical protein